ncbi:MAG: hypothetical protein H6Q04_2459 [Acidobacteria bacterium]|nr:hypothetical protein [Acidobacteriota bacterium]
MQHYVPLPMGTTTLASGFGVTPEDSLMGDDLGAISGEWDTYFEVSHMGLPGHHGDSVFQAEHFAPSEYKFLDLANNLTTFKRFNIYTIQDPKSNNL